MDWQFNNFYLPKNSNWEIYKFRYSEIGELTVNWNNFVIFFLFQKGSKLHFYTLENSRLSILSTIVLFPSF